MHGLINIFHMQVVTCICMEHKYVNTDTCCGVLMCMCTCMWYTTAIGCHDVFCFVIHSKERVGWETQQRYTINVVHTLHSSALSLCCRKFLVMLTWTAFLLQTLLYVDLFSLESWCTNGFICDCIKRKCLGTFCSAYNFYALKCLENLMSECCVHTCNCYWWM